MEKKEKKDEPIIGIDLGTTRCCVATWRVGRPEVIPNDLGERTTPSIVSFTPNQIVVGESARKKMQRNLKNTIYDSKRIIGRKFKDPIVQKDKKYWSFEIEEDINTKKPQYIINTNNKTDKYFPEEISSLILQHIKEFSSQKLDKEVKKAIITVPAYFNNEQREMTKKSGEIAGLEVIRIINEPTAAAIAYGLQNISDKERKVLVFDLGGGTFDVTVLILSKNNGKDDEDKFIQVKSTYGDSHLGGEDFDKCLMKFCIEKFKKENDIDISDNGKAKRRLKVACEKAKIILSSEQETTIEIPNIRTDFEDCCQELFDKCISCVKEALENAEIKKENIDDIVLVGGSTRIPKIQEMVKLFFNRKQLIQNKGVNPDEAVAYGASYLASLINGQINENELLLIDIIGISLGISDSKGKMEVIIPKGTPIPIKKSKIFKISGNKFHKILVKVYQGENELCKDNYFLREFTINIKDTNSKDTKVEVIFEVNVNSIINITANQIGTDNNLNIVIEDVNLALSQEELKVMIDDAKTMRMLDKKVLEIISLKNELLNKCLKEKNNKKSEEIINWIKQNDNKDYIFTKEELLEKMKQLN